MNRHRAHRRVHLCNVPGCTSVHNPLHTGPTVQLRDDAPWPLLERLRHLPAPASHPEAGDV